MSRIVTSAAFVLAFCGASAFAQTTSTERVDQRQANQERRLEAGKNSGDLNAREAARLEKGQARVEKMEEKAMADGKMGKGEARRIERAQDVESARIARQRHDAQKAHKSAPKAPQ